METILLKEVLKWQEKFQKNLVVWKLFSIISLDIIFCVSEELSSVETFPIMQFSLISISFQKNLVVWKHFASHTIFFGSHWVSEELSSVETIEHNAIVHSIDMVSEELSSVETFCIFCFIVEPIVGFQKNLVVWKPFTF